MRARPRMLDLACGAGGAAVGYDAVGFEVVGVDVEKQPHYPFAFWHMDMMEVLRLGLWKRFDAIHASPPCQHYANVTRWRGDQDDHPDLLPSVVEALQETGLPWAVENVPGSPMTPDFVLCGSMFGLSVRRHRWFKTSFNNLSLVPQCNHDDLLPFEHKGERAYADAMGCRWMSSVEARQAIPPAYTRFIGMRMLEVLEASACPSVIGT